MRLDAQTKRVIVGPREALAVKRMALKDVNWIGEAAASEDELHGRGVLVRVRSTRPPLSGTLDTRAGWYVTLDDAEEGVAPGQAAVLYDADVPSRVLGGGWIGRTS